MGSVRCIKGAELIPFYALKWSKIIFLINYSSPDISSVSFQETIYSGANMIALISIPLYHARTCQNQKLKAVSGLLDYHTSYGWSLVVSCYQLILIYSHNKIIFALNPRFTAIGKYPKKVIP